jgi:hypothetical protein
MRRREERSDEGRGEAERFIYPLDENLVHPGALVSQDHYRTIDIGRIISSKKERSGVIEKEGDRRG